MTWHWRICFRRRAIISAITGFVAIGPALQLRAAAVTGSIELSESHRHGTRRPNDRSGVVVWLDPVDSPMNAELRHFQIRQKDKTFSPHILGISVGSVVDFPNMDPIFHNAFSSFNGQVFDIGLYPPGKSRSIEFKRAGVVRVFCNIHPSMSAVIVVVDTPYITTSLKNGDFSFADVRPGHYRLRVFNERSTAEVLEALTRDLEVSNRATVIPPLSISESGYLPVPHKNKYGRDYPPAADEQGYSVPR